MTGKTHDAETVERVAKEICKADPIEAFDENLRWELAADRYRAMARAALSALPPQEVSVQDAARKVVAALDAANPFRTADYHQQPCDCLRCAVDELRALTQETKP